MNDYLIWIVNICRDGAREHERIARELSRLAAKIENPPPGVSVYPGVSSNGNGHGVTFIGAGEAGERGQ